MGDEVERAGERVHGAGDGECGCMKRQQKPRGEKKRKEKQ